MRLNDIEKSIVGLVVLVFSFLVWRFNFTTVDIDLVIDFFIHVFMGLIYFYCSLNIDSKSLRFFWLILGIPLYGILFIGYCIVFAIAASL
ncbi:hypothetical protein MYP_1495 [Sporocytophaga myxococcoides]|uniref:Uncharacterized protein n=1 Tax=Sporocytophaga myxococcoides TaxID=153721 RepID=A0A098LCZ6_9BACT|nr:hypothetical protein [Sporocytophaga myxococcoides]GAL84267.1 hypothetical protein MYP_1495 [Sporocytophaga myxococcoides]